MSAYKFLALAGLAAAVALVATACGTPTPTATTTTTTTQATSGSSTTPTNGSSTTQTNSEYPYEPGGVTINGGEGGGVYTFSIPAGSYSLNEKASYDPANDPDGSGQCEFAGELDYLSGKGWSAPIGGVSPVTEMTPINGPAKIATFGAGDYRVYIYPETTCDWTFELWS
jgi:hypothetical protein